MGSWISWFQYVSPFKYAFESYVTNEYDGIFNIMNPIDKFSFTLGVSMCCFYLFLIGFIFRVIAFINLKMSVVNL